MQIRRGSTAPLSGDNVDLDSLYFGRECSSRKTASDKDEYVVKKWNSTPLASDAMDVARSELHERLKSKTGAQPASKPRKAWIEDQCQKTADDKPIILFDWDDTLFPTTWVYDVVKPHMGNKNYCEDSVICGSSETLPSQEVDPFAEELSALAQDLEALLRAARELAQVAIISLSKRPWVEESAATYLPGIDVRALLEELEISVFYAREHVRAQDIWYAEEEPGLDPFEVAKRFAMSACLEHFLTGQRHGQTSRFNIMSIGDSDAERAAAIELRLCWPHLQDQNSLFKTVKLMESPTFDQLAGELQVLRTWLRRMLAHSEDFDLSLE